MKIKSNIEDMTLSVPVKQLAHLISLASHHDVLVKHLQQNEAKIVRMKSELSNYQSKFERLNESASVVQ